jgi:hypothetical protein
MGYKYGYNVTHIRHIDKWNLGDIVADDLTGNGVRFSNVLAVSRFP